MARRAFALPNLAGLEERLPQVLWDKLSSKYMIEAIVSQLFTAANRNRSRLFGKPAPADPTN